MKVISKILIFLAAITGITKDLFWGEWLQKHESILGSKIIPTLIATHLPWVVVVIFTVSFFIDWYLQSKSSQIKDAQRFVINRFHKELFTSNSPNQDDFNRLTFFTVKSRWIFFRMLRWKFEFYSPFSDYLVITNRSGRFQKSLTSFKIDGDSEIPNNGIAGEAWCKPAQTITRKNLNPLNKIEYCQKTRITEKNFNSLNQKSKHYIAFCVFNTDGNKFGVLVADTINKHSITNAQIFEIAKSLSVFNGANK